MTTTPTNKYASLDTLLVQAIAERPRPFAELQLPTILAAAEPHVVADRFGVKGPAWRILDRRLQALRKQGRIEFVKGRWYIAGTARLV